MRFSIALLVASCVLVGCAAPQRFECRGGDSGASQWHLVEATSKEAARDDGNFGECRAEVHESVVSVEYAGTTYNAQLLAKPGEKWRCDAVYVSRTTIDGKQGPEIVVRRQWDVTWSVKLIPRSRGLVAFMFTSGDPDLDHTFGLNASIQRGIMPAADVRDKLESQVGSYVRSVLVPRIHGVKKRSDRIENVTSKHIGKGYHAACWRPGVDAEPDRSRWPQDTQLTLASAVAVALGVGPLPMPSSGSNAPQLQGISCAGVVWRRDYVGDDLGRTEPTWLFVTGVPGPLSSAESLVRRAILDRIRARGVRFMIAHEDPRVDPEVIACWEGAKPSKTPSSWPESARPWASITEFRSWDPDHLWDQPTTQSKP